MVAYGRPPFRSRIRVWKKRKPYLFAISGLRKTYTLFFVNSGLGKNANPIFFVNSGLGKQATPIFVVKSGLGQKSHENQKLSIPAKT